MDNFGLTLIAAVAKNGVIGNRGEIPWKIKEDLQHFRGLTLYHPVIMGRVTYEEILQKFRRPLDKRFSIVISGGEVRGREGALVVNNLFDAVARAKESADFYNTDTAYVIGGERIYNQTILLPQTRALEITELDDEYMGDRKFPNIDKDVWKEKSRVIGEGYSFVRYEKL